MQSPDSVHIIGLWVQVSNLMDMYKFPGWNLVHAETLAYLRDIPLRYEDTSEYKSSLSIQFDKTMAWDWQQSEVAPARKGDSSDEEIIPDNRSSTPVSSGAAVQDEDPTVDEDQPMTSMAELVELGMETVEL